MSDSGGGGGGGPGGEEGGMEVSGSAVQNVADVSMLQKHLRKLVPLLLEDGGEAPAALEAALEEKGAVEHMRKFLSDPQVHTVLVERSTLKGEAGAEPPRWQNGRCRPRPPPCRGWEGRASAASRLRAPPQRGPGQEAPRVRCRARAVAAGLRAGPAGRRPGLPRRLCSAVRGPGGCAAGLWAQIRACCGRGRSCLERHPKCFVSRPWQRSCGRQAAREVTSWARQRAALKQSESAKTPDKGKKITPA